MDVKYNVCLAHDNDVDVEAFLTIHHAKLQQLSSMLKSFESVDDILVVYLDNEDYPQLVAVDKDKIKVAHIILSAVVLSGAMQCMVFIDNGYAPFPATPASRAH